STRTPLWISRVTGARRRRCSRYVCSARPATTVTSQPWHATRSSASSVRYWPVAAWSGQYDRLKKQILMLETTARARRGPKLGPRKALSVSRWISSVSSVSSVVAILSVPLDRFPQPLLETGRRAEAERVARTADVQASPRLSVRLRPVEHEAPAEAGER